MRPHIAGLRKSLITIGMWTHIRLASGVVIQMCLQVMFLSEGFRTDGACKRLYTWKIIQLLVNVHRNKGRKK